ncbi:MAG: hypothetical protein EOO27_16295 [Comamonadaceae bacterium]|nr:MAG: hypothetical protein EOO27_16295 [Comamonadaceae bacterium]
MADGGSLLLDAKRLTAKARVRRDNAAGIQADGQFATALNKLTSQFSELRIQLESYSRLGEAGIPVGAVPDLTRAADRLKSHITDVGRPTPQFLNSRSTDLATTVKALKALCDEGWKSWATDQRASLTVDPGLLHGHRGELVTAKLEEIARESVKPFQQVNISLFKVWVGQTEDLIALLESPVTADDVIARIEAGRGALTFADLSHDEIEALGHSAEHARLIKLSAR